MRKVLETIFPNQEDWLKTGIYKLYHTSNINKVYIGSAIQTKIYGKSKLRKGFYGRLYYHVWSLKNNKHHSPKLQNFINKYGLEGLRLEIIEFCDKTNSKEKEEYYIKYYDSVKTGFNCSHEGHTNGASLSKEIREIISKKVSEKLKGRVPANWESIKGMKAKPVLEFKDGQFTQEYQSLIEMCTINNLGYKHMSMVLRGKSKLPLFIRNNGLKWIYKDEQ